MDVQVWNEEGQSVKGEVGYLVAPTPAPSMTRSLWNDEARYIESYWSRWPEVWNHGDWAIIDEDGHWFLTGRADDTLKVAGRRIGPAELEGALDRNRQGLRSRCHRRAARDQGHRHRLPSRCSVPGTEPSDALAAKSLSQAIVDRLGKVDRPEKVLFVRRSTLKPEAQRSCDAW